ncbi:MAG: hypothetical protein ACJZ2K_02550 [Candidatus Poseidoniaceae archaeon]|tara:strand:- start:1834 stop:2457 length:624 start_codon:yes stop_codon:yes gene_type:complete
MKNSKQINLELVFDPSKSVFDYLDMMYDCSNFESARSEYKFVKKGINKLRKKRDRQNETTKHYTVERNRLNEEVRAKINEVRKLISLRNLENLQVKKLKKKRDNLTNEMSIMKANPPLFNQKKWDELVESHQESHKEVQNAAQDAQSSHEEVVKKNQLIDELRSGAESSHKQLKGSKKKADNFHNILVVFLERKNELADKINASEEE